jgi:hypothetical protein
MSEIGIFHELRSDAQFAIQGLCGCFRSGRFAASHSGLNKAKAMTIRPIAIASGAKDQFSEPVCREKIAPLN